MTAPAQIQIDLAALERNVSALASLIGPACELLAVVKSDGYGHGLVEAARAALAGGARRAGVSTIDEGVALRAAGLTCPILVMGLFEEADASVIVAQRLTPVINRSGQLTAVVSAVRSCGPARAPHSIHLNVDTGMGRLGLLPDEFWPLIEQAWSAPELVVEGLMTHFAEADLADSAATAEQSRTFSALLDQVKQRARPDRSLIAHAANSAALLTQPASRHQMVRAGLAIYGVAPAAHCRRIVPLAPVMRWTTRIAHLRRLPAGSSLGYGRTFTTKRPSLIGVLPLGYAAGYPRLLSNRAACLHGGARRPIVGRISMDLTMIDLTDQPEAAIGEEVVLLGAQGRASVTADELAAWAQTIPYEILCAAGARNPRRHIEPADDR